MIYLKLERWSIGFDLSLRVTGYELRVMHCRIYCNILTRNAKLETLQFQHSVAPLLHY